MNELLENLINSDIEENRELGSLLLSSKEIPEEEREQYIYKMIDEFLNQNTLNDEMKRNLISAYSNLSKHKNIKNRVIKV